LRLAVYTKKHTLLVVVIITLLLFIKESKVADHIAIVNNHTVNTLPGKKNAIHNHTPQSTSEQDYLNMTLEELMQIPVVSVSLLKNSGNYLDMSLEQLMTIPVSG
jgi:hypothetical protein